MPLTATAPAARPVPLAPHPLEVNLFPDLREEDWPSMDVYADNLGRSLAATGRVKLRCLRPPTPRWRPRATKGYSSRAYLTLLRYGYYLWRARYSPPGLCHVLDHSYGFLLRALRARPTIVTCNDLIPLAAALAAGRKGLSDRQFLDAIGQLGRATHLIAISQSTKQAVIEMLGLPGERITVVYHGIEEDFSQLAEEPCESVRRRLGLPTDAPLALHVGGSEPRKNVETVLRVVGLLRERGLDARLLKVGAPFTRAQRCLAQELGLHSRLVHLGAVSRRRLIDSYRASDLLIFPSLAEGFGRPPLEAMASGTLAVVSDIPPLREAVGDDAPARSPCDAAALADAAEELLRDPDLRRQYQRRGQARARQFTWERCARETLEVYERVVGR